MYLQAKQGRMCALAKGNVGMLPEVRVRTARLSNALQKLKLK